ncbi:ribonuclease P protein component [Chryseobacterium carnipullorum]|uniref:Ribonuclease P protein component n=1 Tax=Chryseobacterium carnipullorum TaxID=1124835 RepID=A0A1M7A7B2_CHRCU|nr:ribonuclease P protein component [Chryseobacterium carnipullorum]MDN5397406.1 ribonuclease P protein component [Chryseobacterium sp.]AZA48045.1 ribonuclease P protein component [Chryseobacterium carnipullorum]AZA67360.1 ribonuclease P protein component [Chryseobacterium carnipullorum]MDN5423537.1 ribonuclease P protein component [Chryseobacterium sp.]MDN5475654.1 ribonuclease P protein component [Chryseobacterium sp.]
MQNFKYSREEKLKKNTEIALLFDKGKWRSCGNLRIIILKDKPNLPVENHKFGVSVSKRYFKKAVHRNRVKRLLRECYRLNKEVYKDAFGEKTLAMMFWVSSEIPAKFQEVEEQFLKLCQMQKKA